MYIFPKYVVLAVLVASTLTSPTTSAQESTAVQEMVSFVQDTCVKCHGGKSTKAGIDLSAFSTELDIWKDRPIWSRAQEAVADGKMPPDTEFPLSEAERGELSGWIRHTLDNVDIERIPRDPGFVPPRRLTGREYNYTVRDLFGLSVETVYAFPEDLVIGDAFDNDASTLTIEPLWFEKAMQAAHATVRAVWADPEALDRLLVVRPSIPLPEDSALYVTPQEISDLCDTGAQDFSVLARVTGKPSRIFIRSPRGRDDTRGSKELAFDGDALVYEIGRRQSLRAEGIEIADDETHWVGLTVRDGNAALYLDGRLLASRPELTRPDIDGHLFKVGAKKRESSRRRRQPVASGQLESLSFYVNGLSDAKMQAVTRKTEDEDVPGASFYWMLGMETPAQENFITEEDAKKKVLLSFLGGAFRRAPSWEEMVRYVGLFQEGLDEGLTFDIALQHPIATALISPAFLFRGESRVDTGEAYQVSAIDLANRLSYFLWSSIPDAELRAVAESGRLTDPDELLKQTDRMLADEKAQRFFDGFVLQWLRTGGLGDTIRPDAARFPEVTDSLLASMRKEGTMLFANAVQENRSLLNLLDAPYTFMNGELAAHYGYSEVTGPEWREVALKDATRGGLLTQAAVLTVSSSPKRTSPVFRGKWVLDVILGEPPQPPPANVPALPSEIKPGGTSLRELLAAHRSQEACAGCHNRIDPYGLALEQYDPVGRLRSEPQDTLTTLYSGELIDGVEELKRYLMTEKKSGFIRHLTQKMLAYSLGRKLRFPDERAVQSILGQLESDNNGAKTLIHGIVLSEPFRYRMNPSNDT